MMGSGARVAVAALMLGGALSACSRGDRVEGPVAPSTVQAIGNAQEMGDVVDALDRGDEKTARRKLQAMLKRNPGDPRARTLLDGIEQDPVVMLGAEAWTYTLRPGDTLIALAGRYLGNADRFYALARYNGIAVPADARPGRQIRIPGTPPKAAPPPPPASRPRAAPPPRATPPAAPKPQPVPAPQRPSADPRRAGQLRAQGLSALNGGDIGRAVQLLRQAQALDPGNPLIQRDLARAVRIQSTVKARR